MKSPELVDLLREFYTERLRLTRRHEAGARLVGQYDFNNAYQYVIARGQSHLDWLRRALADLGGSEPDEVAPPQVPGKDQTAVLADDSRLIQAFLDRWRPRVEQVTDSRQKLMLHVVLGEMSEQKRLFDQALAGRTDLLGRRTSPSTASGRVLPTRWIE